MQNQTIQRVAAIVVLAILGAQAAARATCGCRTFSAITWSCTRNIKIPVWGWDQSGQKVTVTLGPSQASALAGKDGKWRVSLPAMKAGGPHKMSVAGNSTVAFSDVMTGDVWVASGQSNMHFTIGRTGLGGVDGWRNATALADKYPDIRLFLVPKKDPQSAEAKKPQEDCGPATGARFWPQSTAWVACNHDTVMCFSAVGFLFGRDLYDACKVPIGIVDSSLGATTAEQWTSRDALDSRPLSRRPEGPNSSTPCSRRLIPYGIKGVIWYQGEGNTPKAGEYRDLMALLIGDWRKRWGVGDFPFLIVQLATYGRGDGAWAELREAQLRTWQTVPNTALAVTVDFSSGAIHCKNKWDVAARLALAARAIAYGEKVVYSGPIYKEMKIEGNKIRLFFDHVGGGLVAKGGNLKYFEAAGEDRKFYPAKAVIGPSPGSGRANVTILVEATRFPSPSRRAMPGATVRPPAIFTTRRASRPRPSVPMTGKRTAVIEPIRKVNTVIK